MESIPKNPNGMAWRCYEQHLWVQRVQPKKQQMDLGVNTMLLVQILSRFSWSSVETDMNQLFRCEQKRNRMLNHTYFGNGLEIWTWQWKASIYIYIHTYIQYLFLDEFPMFDFRRVDRLQIRFAPLHPMVKIMFPMKIKLKRWYCTISGHSQIHHSVVQFWFNG